MLSERPIKEADRIYSVLTEEFGLLWARAIGVRKQESKLRASLEPYSLIDISLVRGKEYWRVTNAHKSLSLSEEFRDSPEYLRVFARVLSLLEKLVVGEDRLPTLLSEIEDVVDTVRHEEFVPEEAELVEVYLVIRVLSVLGYVSKDDVSEELWGKALSKESLPTISREKSALVTVINRGIEVSGLSR